MKRQYQCPSFVLIKIDLTEVICYSYGNIPVGGTTDTFDDGSYKGTIPTGGEAYEMDAASSRGSWLDYEK